MSLSPKGVNSKTSLTMPVSSNLSVLSGSDEEAAHSFNFSSDAPVRRRSRSRSRSRSRRIRRTLAADRQAFHSVLHCFAQVSKRPATKSADEPEAAEALNEGNLGLGVAQVARLLRKKTLTMGESDPDPSESESPAEGGKKMKRPAAAAGSKPEAGSAWSQTVSSGDEHRGGDQKATRCT